MGLYTKKIYEALGLSEKQNNVFYGNYKGYEVTLHVYQTFEVFVNFHSDEGKKLEAAQVFQKAGSTKMTQTGVSLFGIHAVVNGLTFKKAMEKLTEKLDALVEFLKENNIPGVGSCMSCGATEVELTTVRLNDIYVTLENECMEKLNAIVEASDKEFNDQPNNYVKGVIGALLGAFIGSVAWIILMLLGYISAITAVIAVFLGNFFWVKFGGKANNVKTVVVALISLLAMVLTCHLMYLFAASSEMIELGITNQGAFEYIMATKEWRSEYTTNMLMNGVFTIIGVAIQFGYTKKKDQANRMRISK